MSLLFLFKQKTAYEMRISDWSSDVCSSDLTMPEQEVLFASQAPSPRSFGPILLSAGDRDVIRQTDRLAASLGRAQEYLGRPGVELLPNLCLGGDEIGRAHV